MAALWFGHARAASGTCGLRMAVRSAPDVPPQAACCQWDRAAAGVGPFGHSGREGHPV